jgi:hypothetical protein
MAAVGESVRAAPAVFVLVLACSWWPSMRGGVVGSWRDAARGGEGCCNCKRVSETRRDETTREGDQEGAAGGQAPCRYTTAVARTVTVNGKLEQLRLCIALGAAAELQCDDRHSTISRRGRGRLRQTRQRRRSQTRAPTNSSPHHKADAAPHGRPFDCRRASEKAVVASSVEG